MLYQYWSAINSGFYQNIFDVDTIIAEYEKEKAEAENAVQETMEDFEALESEELSTEEVLYYAEVSARISEKLLEIEY